MKKWLNFSVIILLVFLPEGILENSMFSYLSFTKRIISISSQKEIKINRNKKKTLFIPFPDERIIFEFSNQNKTMKTKNPEKNDICQHYEKLLSGF